MQSAFNNLDKEVQKRLRDKAKEYDSVKLLMYRLKGSSRYNLSIDDVKDTIYWGMNTDNVKVSEIYTKVFKG